MKSILSVCLGLVMTITSVMSHAQDAYPSRPIKLLVGFPPGGGTDALARVVAEHMSKTLKQPIVIENRPGANTTLASMAVAGAAPDGYTLLLAPDAAFGADKALYPSNVKYDAINFTPISQWARTFYILAANKDFGTRNLAELLAKGGKQGNELFIGSVAGLYASLLVETFNKSSSVKLNHVPYKGGGPAVLATVAGETPLTISVPNSIMPMVKDGKLLAIGTTAKGPSELAPGVLTLAEQGLKDFTVEFWFGLVGPAGLPDNVVRVLFDASKQALEDRALRARLLQIGYEPAPSASVKDFQQTIARDSAALVKSIKSLNIRGE